MSQAVLRGKNAAVDNMVIYPPSGVIPFHGFCMFAAPMCYVSHEPAQLYATFKALYLRFWFRLHQVSSHPQSILSLCALFENILMKHEPGTVENFDPEQGIIISFRFLYFIVLDLWLHLLTCEIQPTKIVFR